MPKSTAWRVSFVVAGLLIAIGGPQHPRGTMAQMLADPKWVPSHALMFAGFAALFAGLLFLRGSVSRTWLNLAIGCTAFQALEMAIHTVASIDAANLVAGRPTPVLTTHLVLSVPAYPLFGIGMIGLIVAGWRERSLGSPWIAWIGIIGAIGQGLAAPLTILTSLAWARMLFPLILLVAVWLILAALWPVRARSAAGAPIPAP